LDTIAGFALRYASSFPGTSGGILETFGRQNWLDVYRGACAVLSTDFGVTIIRASYSGVYVDEYQDCISTQHQLVVKLANIIPCRVLGDPLQAVFEFQGTSIVNWDADVFSTFERLPDLSIPWRWKDSNPQLAQWLSQVRQSLESQRQVDLSTAPSSVYWVPKTPDNQRRICYDAMKRNQGITVAIHKWPNEAHAFARQLNGAFVSMEEVECRDLLEWADTLENTAAGPALCLSLIEFAADCVTAVSSQLASVRRKIEQVDFSKGRLQRHADILAELSKLNTVKEWTNILNILDKIRSVPEAVVFRPELWGDMRKAIEQRSSEPKSNLRELAWQIRDVGRTLGRSLRRRCVSRTLLVKGLEFEHCIILNADALTTKELYVALTRARDSVTVLSESQLLTQATQ
jgi:DNA helicase-2/ATP-dependent DNA helicase PcrA